jgi:hypothetical protein
MRCAGAWRAHARADAQRRVDRGLSVHQASHRHRICAGTGHQPPVSEAQQRARLSSAWMAAESGQRRAASIRRCRRRPPALHGGADLAISAVEHWTSPSTAVGGYHGSAATHWQVACGQRHGLTCSACGGCPEPAIPGGLGLASLRSRRSPSVGHLQQAGMCPLGGFRSLDRPGCSAASSWRANRRTGSRVPVQPAWAVAHSSAPGHCRRLNPGVSSGTGHARAPIG